MRVDSEAKLFSQFVHLHDNSWIERQRIAGRYLAEIMSILQDLIKSKANISLLKFDNIIEDEILKRKSVATFKNFKGFPASACISVNKQLVHGIPSDYKLEDGDVITFDFGITYEGAIADSAITLIYGEPKNKEHPRMIETSYKCLYNAIRSIKVGHRIGCIGNAIYKTAKNAGFNVIQKYGGHGITWNKPHADLFIANKSTPEEGIRIQPGLTIAIEPLLVPGNCSTNTKLGSDGWTVYTEDISAHVEHSMYVHSDHVEIVSWRPEEADFIPNKVFFN